MADLAHELLALATDCARRAGALIVERLEAAPSRIASKSSPTDMVSEVDLDAEALIVAAILERRPHDGIIGEESGGRPGTSGVDWYIDPLDGTTNYLYRYPAYCVSIAAAKHGETLAGAVFDAVHGAMYTAAAGHGAFRDGRRLAVSERTELASALVATGFGYDPAYRLQQASLLPHLLPHVRDIRRSGSAALDLCSVAEGRVDAYYEAGVQAWDTAAGLLLVGEAGGGHLTVDLGPRQRPAVVAANAALLEPLAALLREAASQA